ncbi:MAG TPA: PQQ-binding-like beta-propeller repeat protein [Actinoplanes sp.]
MSRIWLRSSVALVLAAAAGLIGWRVLAPAEVLASAATPYPSAVLRALGVTGRTNVAPLIVDGRLRVYAAKRQIRADAPVDAKSVNTARWSFRRWPEQLSGVVAVGHTVISRWSDGELVALDGRTGTITWRSSGPPAPKYDGHRTGAQTVWAPPGLHVADGTVVVTGGGALSAYDVVTGTRRWGVDVPAACTDGFTTAGGAYVCPTGAYDTTSGAAVGGWPAAPYTPIGCDVAASRCAGLRDIAGQGWFTDTLVPGRGTVLDSPGSTIAAGVVFFPAGGGLRVTARTGGTPRSLPAAEVLGAAGDGRVALLTPARHLLVVDPGDGRTVADFPLAVGREKLTWSPGGWQVVDGHVAIERLSTNSPGEYFTAETVILAGF